MATLAPSLVSPEETSLSLSTDSLPDSEKLQSPDDVVPFLIELVGAAKLTTGDDEMVDDDMKVFGVVKFGNEIIHRTAKAVGKNPIWSVSSRSLFLLNTTARELMAKDLHVILWTKKKDPLNITTLETIFLGQATIKASTILSHCSEKRLEVDLVDPAQHGFDDPLGSITLRFRIAADSDVAFLTGQKSSLKRKGPVVKQKADDVWMSCTGAPVLEQTTSAEKITKLPAVARYDESRPMAKLVTETDETEMAGETFVNAISSAFQSKSYYDHSVGTRKVKVKPNPDPKNPEQTAYMTKRELAASTMAPSTSWVQAGSGGLGTLYLEILSCHDLPNVDVGEAVGNVTDCFVAAVFEDAMVQTPVIDDELSPHWLPWTQRAFMFGIMHPASMLYLGAFDFDLGISDHEALGRVAVNISNLQRDTDYTLQYNLYPSSNVTDRTANGSLTIRLRMEYKDEKEAVLRALKPRPKFHVNVKKEKSLKIVHYTCHGEYGDENNEQFDLTVMKSLVNEIFEYKSSLSYAIGDAMRSLIFWRGQVKFGKIFLPLHSLIFFTMATTFVERPSLAPSFFLLTIAWIMLATQNQRRQHPSPWTRCPSFWHFIQIVKCGSSPVEIRRINRHEGAKASAEYEKKWSDRINKDIKDAAAKAEMQEKIQKIGDDNIQTKIAAGGIPLDILARLGRYQGMIGRYCRHFRFIKIILTWEESIVSFWITACFLSAGLVSLILPWSFILLWTGRLIVWGLCGPHMFLVDVYLTSGDDEQVLANAIEKFNGESRLARYRKQDAVKLKDMKCLAFGEFISLIPNFNLVRHHDRPLPGSFARLRHKEAGDKGPVPIAFVPSQQFFGVMVPRTEMLAKDFDAEMPRLKALAKEVLVQIDYLSKFKNELLLEHRQDDEIPDCIGYEVTGERNQKIQVRMTDSTWSARQLRLLSGPDVSSRELTVWRDPKSFGYELICDRTHCIDRQVSLQLAAGATLILEPEMKRAILKVEGHRETTHEIVSDFITMLEKNEDDQKTASEPAQEQGFEILLSSTLEHYGNNDDGEEDCGEADGTLAILETSDSDVFDGLDDADDPNKPGSDLTASKLSRDGTQQAEPNLSSSESHDQSTEKISSFESSDECETISSPALSNETADELGKDELCSFESADEDVVTSVPTDEDAVTSAPTSKRDEPVFIVMYREEK